MKQKKLAEIFWFSAVATVILASDFRIFVGVTVERKLKKKCIR